MKVSVRERGGAIVEAVRRLSDAGVGVDDLALRRPTLDDVFLTADRPRRRGVPARRSEPAARRDGMRRLVTDTLIIAERNLVRLPRAPDLLLAFTVQPIMFVLLFRYVFGGAIRRPGYANYVDFLIPGIIVQNIAFGGFVTALGLNEDVHKGLIDRFRSLPMARAAVLAGRTLADVVTNALSMIVLLITGLIIGFTFQASVTDVVRRHRPAAPVRLRVLVGVRVRRPARLLARVGQLGRVHRRLPADLHLLGVRPDATIPGRAARLRQGQPVHDHRQRDAPPVAGRARRTTRLGRRRVVVVIIAVFAPLAVSRYRRAAGR